MTKTNVQEKAAIPDLAKFFKGLATCASDFKWKLVVSESREVLRGCIENLTLCPVQAVAYIKSGKSTKDREVPSSSHMGGLAGLTHSGVACVVHNADELMASRYFRPEIRARLLRAVGLETVPVAPAVTAAGSQDAVEVSS